MVICISRIQRVKNSVMKKEIKKNIDKSVSPKGPESHVRRKVIKKAAYIAPTLIVLGVLSPIDAVAFSPPDPPNPVIAQAYGQVFAKTGTTASAQWSR